MSIGWRSRTTSLSNRVAAKPLRDPVVQRDDGPDRAVQLRRCLQVEGLAMGDEQLRGGGVALGELVGDAAVLDQRSVSVRRQPRLVDNREPSFQGHGEPRARFGYIEDHFVTEPVELLGNRNQVGLAAPETEVVCAENELHGLETTCGLADE